MYSNARSTVLIYFLLKAFLGFSQTNFVKGEIYTPSKDTISGYIDYQEWIQSPLKISFKKSLDKEIETFTTADLLGFEIMDTKEKYVSMDITLEKLVRDMDLTKFGTIAKYANRKKDLKLKSAFMRVLSSGKITLYHFADNEMGEHFIVNKDNKIEPLIYHVAMIDEGALHITTYQDQLRLLTADGCKSLHIKNLSYKIVQLSKVIDSYNACFSALPVMETQTREKGKLEWGIMAGINVNALNHTIYKDISDDASRDEWRALPTAGVFLNYQAPRLRGRLALQNEVYFYRYQKTFTTRNGDRSFHHLLSYIGINNLIRYSFKISNPTFYMLAGISNGVMIKNGSYVGLLGSKRKLGEDFRKHEVAVVAGVGSRFKKMAFEARFTLGNGFTPYPDYRSISKSLSFMGRYYIK